MSSFTKTAIFYASVFSASVFAATSSASAHSHRAHGHASAHASSHAGHIQHVANAHAQHVAGRHGRAGFRYASYHRHMGYGASVIQCVAFAKQDAGIDISGNARDWWSRAAGVYDRGSRPEAGSVLSFRETGRMPMGHVAVVSATLDSRTIVIDQSHWNSRGITRDVQVEDVSENNDWTAVRVQLTRGGEYGSIYPTHGFIYPRPGNGRADEESPIPVVQQVSHRHHAVLEVAEAPASSGPIDLTVGGIATDAPNRAFR